MAILNTFTAPITKIVNVNWGAKYWVHVQCRANTLSGTASIALKKDSGQVLDQSSYFFENATGQAQTIYQLWLPTFAAEDPEGASVIVYVPAPLGDPPFFAQVESFNDPNFPPSVKVGNDTLEDAKVGLAPTAHPTYLGPLGQGGMVQYQGFNTSAAAKKALADIETIQRVTGPSWPAGHVVNFLDRYDQWRLLVWGQGVDHDGNLTLGTAKYTIAEESLVQSSDGFCIINYLLEIPEAKDDDTTSFELILAGGFDSSDDPSWQVEVDVYSVKSRNQGEGGKYLDHEIIPSEAGSFLIDPADDELWSANQLTADGNPFGILPGTYAWCMRRRPWKRSDPDGDKSGTDDPTNPGKLIEAFALDTKWQETALRARAQDDLITSFDDIGPFTGAPPGIAP
jgi:hypothetical protein